VISLKTLHKFAPSGFLLTTDKVAERLGCSMSRVRQLTRAGRLKAMRLGTSDRHCVYDAGKVAQFAQEPRTSGRPSSGHVRD